jgi:hypothetical protein
MSYNDEPQYGGLIDWSYISSVIMLFIVVFLVSWMIIVILDYPNYTCDYDSCSQESEYWEVEGRKCFNETDPDCQDFLRLWNYCQDYKRRVGITC